MKRKLNKIDNDTNKKSKINFSHRSAFYHRNRFPVKVIESPFDYSLKNHTFKSAMSAAEHFNCSYFYIDLAIKKKMYLMGKYMMEYQY
jgi:hypothetical protein